MATWEGQEGATRMFSDRALSWHPDPTPLNQFPSRCLSPINLIKDLFWVRTMSWTM